MEEEKRMKDEKEEQKTVIAELKQDNEKLHRECKELRRQMNKMTKFVNNLAKQQYQMNEDGGYDHYDASLTQVGV